MPAPLSAVNPGTPRSVAVIGAGWAGLAAAVKGCQAGARVTVFEAARVPGGRARSVAIATPNGHGMTLDNGQHILIGAYRASLALMATVGVDVPRGLRRQSLDLRDAHGHGLALPAWPAALQPLAGPWGVLRATGWSWSMRMGLLRSLHAWQRAGFACPADTTVAQLCRGLPGAVMQQFVEPLCTAALNTPVETASGEVFLRVLKDSVAAGPGSADLLLPAIPLGALLAEPACAWLSRQGAEVRLGARVGAVRPGEPAGRDPAQGQAPAWWIDGEAFDAVVVATPVWEAMRLLGGLAEAVAPPPHSANWPSQEPLTTWLRAASGLHHEAIGTVYLQAEPAGAAERMFVRPMLALQQGPAQFAFDRHHLSGDKGVSAWVASTLTLDKAALERAVRAQAQAVAPSWQWQPLATIVEKRATFACTAGLARPGMQPCAAWPSLAVCGDYVAGPYPATLEGAVLSGAQAMASVLKGV